ncbi:hypothetical protein QZH41_000839 [Actinostola sp. cb2023]|nr:hypothetical protein QZH41_000839 [Actinostola sp. cb2023]
MQEQSKISSFFGSAVTKRSAEEVEVNDNSPPKKISKPDKPTTHQESTSPEEKLTLSPEQKARMEEKRKEAQLKLLSKKGPQNFGLSWKTALAAEFDKDYFQKLSKFVADERTRKTICPPEKEVFSWTLHCDISEIKVVIIGQDPYHGQRQAHGETNEDPGLVKMCVPMVLLGLTFEAFQGWEKFTDAVIRWINSNLQGVVFLLWGAYAQKKCSFIDKTETFLKD